MDKEQIFRAITQAHYGKSTGMLKVRNTVTSKMIGVYFIEGEITSAFGNTEADRLGQILVADKVVTSGQLEKALRIQENPGGDFQRLGAVFAGMGVSPDAILFGLSKQLIRLLDALSKEQFDECVFRTDVPVPEDIRIAASTSELLEAWGNLGILLSPVSKLQPIVRSSVPQSAVSPAATSSEQMNVVETEAIETHPAENRRMSNEKASTPTKEEPVTSPQPVQDITSKEMNDEVDPDELLVRARQMLSAGKRMQAMSVLRQVLQIDPNNLEAQSMLGLKRK